ncbi:hypothetical protein D3C73_1438670 [compost metagenome]
MIVDLLFFMKDEKPGARLEKTAADPLPFFPRQVRLNKIEPNRQIENPMSFIQRLRIQLTRPVIRNIPMDRIAGIMLRIG